jgi:hypothetical protein
MVHGRRLCNLRRNQSSRHAILAFQELTLGRVDIRLGFPTRHLGSIFRSNDEAEMTPVVETATPEEPAAAECGTASPERGVGRASLSSVPSNQASLHHRPPHLFDETLTVALITDASHQDFEFVVAAGQAWRDPSALIAEGTPRFNAGNGSPAWLIGQCQLRHRHHFFAQLLCKLARSQPPRMKKRSGTVGPVAQLARSACSASNCTCVSNT